MNAGVLKKGNRNENENKRRKKRKKPTMHDVFSSNATNDESF